MKSLIDLHMHSTASDGRLAPEELVALVASRGVRVFALTDHDTVAGLEEAGSAARAHGLLLLPAAELSAEWLGRTIHIVGLGLDPVAPVLTAMLGRLAGCRAARAGLIATRLDRARAPGQAALAAATAAVGGDPARVTRTHFARALVDLGAAPTAESAFERWLGHGGGAYVAAGWPPLEDIVGTLVAAGAAPVIAHPLRYTLSAGQRRRLGAEFKAAGGAAVEVVVGGQGAAQVESATALALRAGLAGSVGSDFHDPATPWNPPGRLAKLPGAVPAVWDRWTAVQDALAA